MMGNCFGLEPSEPSLPEEDVEERRQRQAEAAMKRQKEQEARGLKNPELVKQKQRRKEEAERKAEAAGTSEGPLRAMSLHLAAESGRLDDVKHFLTDDNVDSADEKGKTPLHYAVMKCHSETVKYLVEQRANVNIKDTASERTPLHCAAMKDHSEIVRYLMEHGAKVDIKDKSEMTALHYATMREASSLSVVECLVENGADVNSKDEENMTPLHNAARFANMGVVKYLVDHQADLNINDKFGYSPVYKAAEWKHDQVVKYLIEHGAKQDDAISAVLDCLEKAVRTNDKENFERCMTQIHEFELQGYPIAEMFMKRHSSSMALHHAAAAGATEMVKALIEILGAKLDMKAKLFVKERVKYEQISPLRLAAEYGHYGTVKYLIDKGADVNITDRKETTPLHAAASAGHREIVEFLVVKGAVIDCKGVKIGQQDKKRTPLHLACYNGHTETARILLQKGADPTAKDCYGRNCLHLAIRAHRKATVEVLLEDKKWKEMMKESDDSKLHIPMANLIGKMPDIAEMVLSKCIETNEGRMEGSTEEIYPTSIKYQVTYDYELLDRVIPHSSPAALSSKNSTMFHWQEEFKKRHPLNLISESDNANLLFHPLVTSLMMHKWNSFGHKLFFANLSLYVLFLLFLTGFALMALSPLEQTLEQSVNETGPGDCGCTFEYRIHEIFAASTILLAVTRLIMEMVQLIIHRPLAYLSDPVNYIEISLYVSSIIFSFVFTTPCLNIHHWQWQFGVLAVFLGWIVLITFLQKWPRPGIYVIAFLKTMESFLKVSFLAVLLVIAFALPFYMQFFEPGKARHAFIHPARAVVKVMSMTTGELDYDDIFHHKEGEEEIAFPLISFPLWVIFLVMMPVLLNNYLTGLAVGDVKPMLEQCKANRAKLQIDLVLSLEGMLKSFDLHHLFLFPPIPMRYGPIDINMPNSFSDHYYTTGQEIAEVIKPRPKPIEEHLKLQSEEMKQQLENKLKQQTMEQGQQLEEKLRQQNCDQGQQLEEKLRQQNRDQGQQLEEKLRQQNRDQGQQLEEKLRQQNQEQGQQLEEKLRQQNQEQAQQLEEKLRQQNCDQGQQLEEKLRQQNRDQGQQLEEKLRQQNRDQGQQLEEKLRQQNQEQGQQLEEKLRQQNQEQAQQLEEKLRQQNCDQGQQLEENLKQQSHEQGQQLEANLKQQNQEQLQQLKEKLKLQSKEHSKQLSEQSAEHNEQLQQLEGRLQEQLNKTESQIRQLADDIASMKEILMKFASK